MVVDVAVGYGDEVSGVSQIDQSIVVVFIMVGVGRYIDVVDPYVCGLFC